MQRLCGPLRLGRARYNITPCRAALCDVLWPLAPLHSAPLVTEMGRYCRFITLIETGALPPAGKVTSINISCTRALCLAVLSPVDTATGGVTISIFGLRHKPIEGRVGIAVASIRIGRQYERHAGINSVPRTLNAVEAINTRALCIMQIPPNETLIKCVAFNIIV